jgi:hypothetical protein
MNSRFAGLLTRLYPPAWRARYGAEYRMFLEARSVPAVEILDVIAQAAVEQVREKWRHSPILIALLFAVGGGLRLAGGHAGETMTQHPVLTAAWLAMEAGALAVLLYALLLSIAIPLTLDLISKRVRWMLLLAAAVWAVSQYLPWRWTSGRWAAALAGGSAAVAGTVGIGFAGMYAKLVLGRLLPELEQEDLEDLHPLIQYAWSETGKWEPAKLEALRLSVLILSSTLFAVQLRRFDPLVSTYIILGTSLALFWDDVFNEAEI